ncbi:GAF domain-containing protein [Niveispirillum fermenti]|uniref:GAF domain-containing protein n=1 Tax=Niveispirillum fermenti TaxID=1233113 RepID=UPI004041A0B4
MPRLSVIRILSADKTGLCNGRGPMRHVRSALAVFQGQAEDLSRIFAAACRDIVENLAVSSGSVWFFDDEGRTIECVALFDARDARLLQGTYLREADCAPYFNALKRDHRVVADDARTHPSTRGLGVYLLHRDVHSLLDHVVCADGRPVAVLCCEQAARPRHWSDDDAAYLQQMAITLGVAVDLLAQQRRRAG